MELQLGDRDHTRVPGIYGRAVARSIMSRYIRRSKRNEFDDRRMNDGEIGCLLSHLRVYEESFKRDDDYILVMEDDANTVSWMDQGTVNFLMDNYQGHDCIKLCIILPTHTVLPPEKKPILMDWNENFKKYYPWGFTWSTACYLISRSARERLVKMFRGEKHRIRPADYFIYHNLDSRVLFPPLVCNNLAFDTSVQNETMDYHARSFHRIHDHYFHKRLLLIAVWFGSLPRYFDLWVTTVAGKNYDVLLVTDQEVTDRPENLKHLSMTWIRFQDHLNRETGYSIALADPSKLVDVKPLFGFLFRNFIHGYEYWGWTDIDMLMGDVSGVLDAHPGYDIYSNGNASFGPLMIFRDSCTDVYRSIEHYEKILNDPYVCKVDEPWWFIHNQNTDDGALYSDEGSTVRYYSGGTILDFTRQKKTYTCPWHNICVGIDWDIRDTLKTRKQETWVYRITGNKLFRNDQEINHCHLTLLKNNEHFLSLVPRIRQKIPCRFAVRFSFHYRGECLDGLTTYDVYKRFVRIHIV